MYIIIRQIFKLKMIFLMRCLVFCYSGELICGATQWWTHIQAQIKIAKPINQLVYSEPSLWGHPFYTRNVASPQILKSIHLCLDFHGSAKQALNTGTTSKNSLVIGHDLISTNFWRCSNVMSPQGGFLRGVDLCHSGLFKEVPNYTY